MRRLAERDTVQRVGPRAGGQGADHPVGQLADDRIEHVGLFDALGQGRWPPDQAWLAVRARPAGGGEGWPHGYGLPARGGGLPPRPVTNR